MSSAAFLLGDDVGDMCLLVHLPPRLDSSVDYSLDRGNPINI